MDHKIIIGAGGMQQSGWQSLERADLDIRDQSAWLALFHPSSLTAVLSEHVLEHLYPSEALQTVQNIFAMLRPGGYWRLAVPDANNPDPKYQEHCRPGGPGQTRLAATWARGFPDHKAHYNLETLSSLLSFAGFRVFPLEWYDTGGVFHQHDWRRSAGDIKRSAGSFYLLLSFLWADCWNTSLIVDAVKPPR